MSVTAVGLGSHNHYATEAEEHSSVLKGPDGTKVQERPALELSDLSQPVPLEPAEFPASTERNRLRYRTVLVALFWCFFTIGLNDGSTGPLLPAYQRDYKVRP